MSNSFNRYDNQLMINGWRQDYLSRSEFIITGASTGLGAKVALQSACLGVGKLTLVDDRMIQQNSPEKYLYGSFFNKPAGPVLAKKLSEINPTVETIRPLLVPLNEYSCFNIGNAVTVDDVPTKIIIDCENDSNSSVHIHNYARKMGIPLVYARADCDYGVMYVAQSDDEFDLVDSMRGLRFEGAPSEGIGTFIASAAVNEARMKILPIRGECAMGGALVYDPNTKKRFKILPTSNDIKSYHPSTRGFEPSHSTLSSRIVFIGVGGSGSIAATYLGIAGARDMFLVDGDRVVDRNLNRQFMYYDCIKPDSQGNYEIIDGEITGEFKAKALSRKLRGATGRRAPEYKTVFMDENNTDELLGDADIIVGCADSWKARAVMNRYAVENEKIFVDAGMTPFFGQMVAYKPKETPCADCCIKVYEREYAEATSCAVRKESGVVMMNAAFAGLMIEEILRITDNDWTAHSGRIFYSLYRSERGIGQGLLPKDGCGCNQ